MAKNMGGGSSQGSSKPTLLRRPPQTRPKDKPLGPGSFKNSGGGKQRG